jgi:uncharacterized delta-60 repeat protein
MYVIGKSGNKVALAHLLANGTLDPAFGAAGITEIDTGGAGLPVYETPDIWVRPDGTILFTDASMFAGVARMFVGRLLANGTPDPAFGGGDGIVEVPGANPVPLTPRHGILAPDGSVWLVGAESGTSVLVHVLANGTLDPNFGSGGVQTAPVPTPFTGRYSDAILDGQGRFLIGGYSTHMAVMRLNADGRPDTTFGTNGLGQIPIPGTSGGEIYSLAIQPSGRIVAVGDAWSASTEFGGVAFTPAGVVDTTWGNSGTFWENVGPYDSQAYGSLATPDRIYVTGLVVRDAQNWAELHVLDRNGQLDTSFSGDGKIDLGDDTFYFETMATVEGDQGLAVISWGDFLTRRWDVERIPDYADASADWNDGSGAFGICLASAGTATATWPSTGTCPQSDGTNWRSVPRRSLDATSTAVSRPAAGTSTATFRFGLRVPSTQKAGRYTAPVSFEVVAP